MPPVPLIEPDVPLIEPDVPLIEPPVPLIEPPVPLIEPDVLPVPPIESEPLIVPPEPEVDIVPLRDERRRFMLRPRLERMLRDEFALGLDRMDEPVVLDIEPVSPLIEPDVAVPFVPDVPVVCAIAAAGRISAAAAAMVRIRMEVSPLVCRVNTLERRRFLILT